MSLFGYFVIARSDRPLYELSAIHRLCTESVDGISAGTLANLCVDGDWQLMQVLNGWLANLAVKLVEQTSAPAMSIYVVESEFGNIDAVDVDGSSWWGYLNPDAAVRGYDAPEPPDLMDVVASAVAWASAAGRFADPVAVARALQGRVGPFGDGVDTFIEALGFRFGPGGGLPEDLGS